MLRKQTTGDQNEKPNPDHTERRVGIFRNHPQPHQRPSRMDASHERDRPPRDARRRRSAISSTADRAATSPTTWPMGWSPDSPCSPRSTQPSSAGWDGPSAAKSNGKPESHKDCPISQASSPTAQSKLKPSAETPPQEQISNKSRWKILPAATPYDSTLPGTRRQDSNSRRKTKDRAMDTIEKMPPRKRLSDRLTCRPNSGKTSTCAATATP